MNGKLRKLLAAALLLALLAGLAVTGRQALDRRKGAQDYEEAERLADLPLPDAPAPAPLPDQEAGSVYADAHAAALAELDLDALRAVNGDVLGWIDIPDTQLSYPWLQGEDNSYYLDHTWKRENSSVGAVFLEEQSSPDLGDFNTILYGHRMMDLSMFGSLKYYKDPAYREAHPYVYLSDANGAYRYEVFAAFQAGVREMPFRLGLTSREDREAFLQFSLDRSVIDTGVVPGPEDRILTLSTCTGRGHAARWIVQAVLWAEEP